MNDHQRKARNQWIWSAGLLLAGVAAFLGEWAGAEWAAALLVVATILVVASGATAIGAVASGSRSMSGGKRTVLLWSTWSLTLQLVTFVITGGYEASIVASPLCKVTYEANGVSSEGCGYLYAYMLIGIGGSLAIAAIIALLGAVISGLINAVLRRQSWWLVAILTTLLAALAVVIWDPLALSHPQWEGYSPLLDVQGWLIPLAPLFVSILMVIFSLSGARQPMPEIG